MNLENKIICMLKEKKNNGFMSPEEIYNYLIQNTIIKTYMSSDLDVTTFEEFYEYIKSNKLSKVILDYIQFEDFNERY